MVKGAAKTLGWVWLVVSATCAAAPDLLLLEKYRPGMDIAGWYMSEKLDGVRAYWNGEELLSRQGNAFAAPHWFLADFPPFELDGELWLGRNRFAEVQSVTSHAKPGDRWHEITYNVFEVPHAPGGLAERLGRLQRHLSVHTDTSIRIIPQTPCRDDRQLQTRLAEVTAAGGEGLVLRNPAAPYEAGRSPRALKVKTFDDMEGVVTGYTPGKGKYVGMVGALEVRIDGGKRFRIGSGLSDDDRKHPPPIGAVITFRHQGFTTNGIPRFASFWRVREMP